MYDGKFFIFKWAKLEEFMSKRIERLLAVSIEYKGKFIIYKRD